MSMFLSSHVMGSAERDGVDWWRLGLPVVCACWGLPAWPPVQGPVSFPAGASKSVSLTPLYGTYRCEITCHSDNNLISCHTLTQCWFLLSILLSFLCSFQLVHVLFCAYSLTLSLFSSVISCHSPDLILLFFSALSI